MCRECIFRQYNYYLIVFFTQQFHLKLYSCRSQTMFQHMQFSTQPVQQNQVIKSHDIPQTTSILLLQAHNKPASLPSAAVICICCSKWIHLCKSDLHQLCMPQLACMRCVTTNLFKVEHSRAATLKRQGFSAAN